MPGSGSSVTRWPLPRERELLTLSVEHNPPRFERADAPRGHRYARLDRLRKTLTVRPDSHSGRPT